MQLIAMNKLTLIILINVMIIIVKSPTHDLCFNVMLNRQLFLQKHIFAHPTVNEPLALNSLSEYPTN
jgi:hypothetical protein